MTMYLPKDASANRVREALKARENRLEIVRALSSGQVTRRELFKWGLFTASGLLAWKNGLNVYAPSAYGQVPTGTPRSPLFGVSKFTQELQRLDIPTPIQLTRTAAGNAAFPANSGERDAKRLSYHADFSAWKMANPGTPLSQCPFANPYTGRGPIEGRPPGEAFAHQRWDEFFPKVAYVLSLAEVGPSSGFHPGFPFQEPNTIWCYGFGKNARGSFPPPLIKMRYGEPVLTRVYNNLKDIEKETQPNMPPPDLNRGFGRAETTLHFHNAHNGAESDGAANVHHFPGTFYDYRWSTTLARRDKINTGATVNKASGPNGNGGLVQVAGDFREIQGSMWAHDHRFFFTAENIYKGNVMAVNMYSGPDRGNEKLTDGINLKLPSGSLLDWGNVDFDVNLIIHDLATTADGQAFYDIFTTDGFLGDLLCVNMQYAPFMQVLPRKYRFRLLNACMARFVKLALSWNWTKVPFKFIANDGNLVVQPIDLLELDEMGTGERYDIVIDFSRFRIGDRVYLVNLLQQRDGRAPEEALTLQQAMTGVPDKDPAVGPLMEFRIVGQVQSVDVPGYVHRSTTLDKSVVPTPLTQQIPIVTPVRTRVLEFGRQGAGDARNPVTGQCTPDCPGPEIIPEFPWTIRVNGEDTHSFNANRIALLVPKPGEVEHWTYINSEDGWDHPIHLHFEEGITIDRGTASIPATERLVRKDVWRLRPLGRVTFQVQFGEYGGAYTNHCHNTAHEDFAMTQRLQLFGNAGTPQATVTLTPNPTRDGVFFTTPEILPEADPRNGQS
jgi:FtsP/CotA-like multicopper oxidase with cupredoxin domain